MKKIIAAGMISLMSFGAIAGTVAYEAPVVVQIEEPPARMGGSGSWLIPLAVVVVLALLLTPGDEVQASDSRLKTNIAQIGVSASGLPLYSFSYIGLTEVYTGVMAQDVLMHTPEAVLIGPLGFMVVDYGMLGLEMQQLN